MAILSVEKSKTNYVLNNSTTKQYSIVFEENCNSIGRREEGRILVKSRRDVELLLLCLGEEVSVVMDNNSRIHYPDVWEWLNGHTYTEVLEKLKWSYREEDEVINIVEKIPLPRALDSSFIQTSNDEPEPKVIEREFVHKHQKDNILISEPFKCGKMFYFNGFKESGEFRIDHSSDHLEGIVIFEAARQSSIASVHLTGIPTTGTIVLLKNTIQYKKFVEKDVPYLIRTIPVIKQRGGLSYCVYHIIQKGDTCAKGYCTGIVYKTKEAYERFRKSKVFNKDTNEK